MPTAQAEAPTSDPVAAARPTTRPALALGLTFLLLGVGFACPVRLAPHPPAHMWDGNISPETLNLYTLTAFAGWSHFLYAWRGQFKASRRWQPSRRWTYWLAVAAFLGCLALLRQWIGLAVFSLLAWVYNIAHFVKAEIFFTGKRETRVAFFSPVLAFAWFTLCLFEVGPLRHPGAVFAGSITIAAITLLAGSWRSLARGDVQLPLLTLFLLSEAMVWASYGPSDAFRVGVYVFHIAAASFYHYLSSYFFAESSGASHRDPLLRPFGILFINIAAFALCLAVTWYPPLRTLQPVFGIPWFTLWVALHLAASDLQPWWKRRT